MTNGLLKSTIYLIYFDLESPSELFLYHHLLQNINNANYKIVNLNKLTLVEDTILIIGNKIYYNGKPFNSKEKNQQKGKKYLLIGCSDIYQNIRNELLKNKYFLKEYQDPETVIFEKV